MPRHTRRIPAYRLHRPSGQAVVTLNYHDHYLGAFGSRASRSEYDRLIGIWLQRGRGISPLHDAAACELSVIEVIVAYLTFAQGYYRKDGHATSEYSSILHALRFVEPHYGRQPVSDFGPIALQAVMQRMIEHGLARRTINQHLGRVKRLFKWAVAQELIEPRISQALGSVTGLRQGRTAAKETSPVMPVEDAVVDVTLPFLPNLVASMVRLQRLSGMRPAEVCLLRPCDIDRSGEIWTYCPLSHKTQHRGRERQIFLGPQAQKLLLPYLTLRESKMFCFQPLESEMRRRAARHTIRRTPIQQGNRPGTNRKANPRRPPGDRYNTNSYRRAIHRACDAAFPHPTMSGRKERTLSEPERAELRSWRSTHRWSPNQLRHSAATQIRREFGIEGAQITLGHASVDVTQVYAERDMAKGIEIARRIG
jgi:integrase